MKKYMFLIVFSLSLLFLLPLDTYAYVDSGWHVPYDSSSVNHYTDFRSYYGCWTGNVSGTNRGSCRIYFTDVSFSKGRNDYLEFPIFVYIQPLNYEATYDTDVVENNTMGYDILNSGLTTTFMAEMSEDHVNYTSTTCTFYTNQVNDPKIMSGVLRCPLNGAANYFENLLMYYSWDTDNVNSSHKAFFGTTGWINYLRHDMVDSDTIVSAQQQTTSAINNLNDNMSNSDTTSANSKGTTFFANFGNHDNAHLSTILTAPLRLFSAMQTECSQPLNIPVGFNNSTNGAIPTRNIQLQCYANFWNRQDVQTFRTFWNLLIGGPAIYGLLVLLMKVFNAALDPLNDALVAIDISSKKSLKENEKGSDDSV